VLRTTREPQQSRPCGRTRLGIKSAVTLWQER